jgi:putative phosphoesterase
MLTLGLIADTQAPLRPEVHRALRGVDLIFHVGNIGSASVLEELSTIAPTRAVRGPQDAASASGTAERIDEKFEQVHVVVTYGHELERPDPPRLVSAYMHADVIVYAHSSLPLITRAARRLVINPGAAGDEFIGPSPSVARLYIDKRQCDAVLIQLLPVDIPDDPDE